MNKYDFVAFDLDGTLVNTFPFIIASYKKALITKYGQVNESDESIKSQIGMPIINFFKAHPEKDRQELIELYVTDNDLLQKNGVPFFDGITEMLNQLKKIVKVGLVTSKRKGALWFWLNQVGLSDFFDVIVAKEDTVKNKPYAEPVLKAVELSGVKKEKSLYVGDARFDLMSAHNAGVDACLVSWAAFDYDYYADLLPEYYPKNPSDIVKIVKGTN